MRQIGLSDCLRPQLPQQGPHLGECATRQTLQFGGAAPGHIRVAFPELRQAASYEVDGEEKLGYDVVEFAGQPAPLRGGGLLLGLAEKLCLRLFELHRALVDHRLEVAAVVDQLRLCLDRVVDHLQAHGDHEAEEAEVRENHEVECGELDGEFFQDREEEPSDPDRKSERRVAFSAPELLHIGNDDVADRRDHGHAEEGEQRRVLIREHQQGLIPRQGHGLNALRDVDDEVGSDDPGQSVDRERGSGGPQEGAGAHPGVRSHEPEEGNEAQRSEDPADAIR